MKVGIKALIKKINNLFQLFKVKKLTKTLYIIGLGIKIIVQIN
jgi:hypothetical protein